MQLVFDFITEIELKEKETKAQALVTKLPYFENPKDDNARLLNCQHDFYLGIKGAWEEMWNIAFPICERMVKSECKKNRLRYSFDEKYDKTVSAVTYVLRRFKTRPGYFIRYNFIMQLQGGVRHALYHQTKADKIVDFVSDEQLGTLARMSGDKYGGVETDTQD